MQPCMNLGSSLETCATLTLVLRQSQVEFVTLRLKWGWQSAQFEGGSVVGTFRMLAPASRAPVSLIPTSPTCFHAGCKGVALAPNWKKNCEPKATKGHNARCIATWPPWGPLLALLPNAGLRQP